MEAKLRDWRIFSLLCVLLGGMGQGVVAPRLPELLKGSSELALASGVSATLMYLGIFLSTFRYGKWADQGRVHWLLGPGLVGYSLSLALLANSSTSAMVFAVRFLEGLALSAIYVAADFILGRQSKSHERGQWLSYYGVALSIGLLLGPAFALGMARALPGITDRLPILLVAIWVLGLGIAAIRVRIPQIVHSEVAHTPWRQGALMTGAVYGFMEAALVAVLPILAVTEFKVMPELMLIIVIISAALSSVVWGTLADRRGPGSIARALVTLLVVLTALLAALAPLMGPHLTAYLCCLIFGALAGGLYPVGFSWLLQGMPEGQYGAASGAFARAYGIGSLLGPVLAGAAAQWSGARGMLVVMALAGLIAMTRILSQDNAKAL